MVAKERRKAAERETPVTGFDVDRQPIEESLAVVSLHDPDSLGERRPLGPARSHLTPVTPSDGYRRAQHVSRITALALRVFPVLEDELTVAVNRPLTRNSDVEVEVGRTAGARIEAAYHVDHGSPVHHRAWCPDVVPHEELTVVILGDSALRWASTNGAVVREQANVAVDEAGLLMLLEPGHASGKGIREQTVVCVEENHIGASTLAEAAVSSHGGASIVLPEAANARKSGSDPTGVVRRSVIDDDNLAMRVGLARHRGECVGQEAGLIEARDDDGH